MTRPQEDLGKASFREAMRARAAEARRGLGEHPPVATLVAYHGGRLSPEEEESLRDHLTLCPECQELVLDLAAFDESSPGEGAEFLAALRDCRFGRCGTCPGGADGREHRPPKDSGPQNRLVCGSCGPAGKLLRHLANGPDGISTARTGLRR